MEQQLGYFFGPIEFNPSDMNRTLAGSFLREN